MEKLIIIGAGGYSKSVLDSVDYFNYSILGFLDEFSHDSFHLGFPVIAKKLEDLDKDDDLRFFIAIGNNENRKKWYDRLQSGGFRLINVIDRSAIVSSHAQVGNGCFIGKMAIVNSGAVVGNDCIINTKSLIEHGCYVGDHVNVSTNAVLNGDVKVGRALLSVVLPLLLANYQLAIGLQLVPVRLLLEKCQTPLRSPEFQQK